MHGQVDQEIHEKVLKHTAFAHAHASGAKFVTYMIVIIMIMILYDII